MSMKTTQGSIVPTLLFLLSLISFVSLHFFQTPLPFFSCFGFQKLFVLCGWLSAFSLALMMQSEFCDIQSVRDSLYRTFNPFREELAADGIDFRGSLICDTGKLILRFSGLYLLTLSCFAMFANLPYSIFFNQEGKSSPSIIGYFLLLFGYLIVLVSYHQKPFIEYSNPELTSRTEASEKSRVGAIFILFSLPFLAFIGIGVFTKHPFFLSLVPYECLDLSVLDGQLESFSLTLVAVAAVLALITRNTFNVYLYLVNLYINRQQSIEMLMQMETDKWRRREESNFHAPEEHETRQKAQDVNINRETS
ncbi:hypothetical protein NIES4101_28200 (plasmid) [Calothrix sp. NIES-4101]|nr:hypothetical protein NIES4101_28200 [Calothrix sp. NIES-4101]